MKDTEIIDKFETLKAIESSLTLGEVIFLANEYIEFSNLIESKWSDDSVQDLVNFALYTNWDNEGVSEKVDVLLFNILDKSSSDIARNIRLASEIRDILSILNLRYFVWLIKEKENKTLGEISISIGCDKSALSRLCHIGTISRVDLDKFLRYYKINGIVKHWLQGYVVE